MTVSLIILGFICVAISLLIIWFKVPEMTVGKNLSRFLAVFLIAIGYYYIAEKLSHILSFGVSISNSVIKYSIGGILIIFAGIFLYNVVKNWKSEGGAIIKKASPLFIIAIALLIIARFLFSAGLK